MNSPILIIAGENSGDKYGAALVEEFYTLDPDANFFGIGGPQMRQANVDCVFGIEDLSMVGIFEVISHLKKVRRIFRVIRGEVRKRKPRAAVLIDSPDFNLRIAGNLKKLGVPILYYISPTVWAWRSGRLKAIKRHVDRMLLIFPFEEKIYRDNGIPASFVGHPLIERVKPSLSRQEFFQKYGLDPGKKLVALMPGSRDIEIRYHMPRLTPALDPIARNFDVQYILIRAENIPACDLKDMLPAGYRAIPIIKEDIYSCLKASDLALSSCGTANLEAALLETPVVAFYRLSSLSYALGIKLMKIPRFSIVNILAGKPVIPELIQNEFTPETLVKTAGDILSSENKIQAMKADFRKIRSSLGQKKASLNAARELKSLLG